MPCMLRAETTKSALQPRIYLHKMIAYQAPTFAVFDAVIIIHLHPLCLFARTYNAFTLGARPCENFYVHHVVHRPPLGLVVILALVEYEVPRLQVVHRSHSDRQSVNLVALVSSPELEAKVVLEISHASAYKSAAVQKQWLLVQLHSFLGTSLASAVAVRAVVPFPIWHPQVGLGTRQKLFSQLHLEFRRGLPRYVCGLFCLLGIHFLTLSLFLKLLKRVL
mmetsp:Transcript_34206/g.65345  ORF Transcript_34206/g.65345 Transcript_34206/m.65345 type:complete len:221 (-) Transcript_34206:606-1268(-)